MQIKKDINLIPKDILKQRRGREQTRVLLLVLILIVFLSLSILLIFYNQSMQMGRRIIQLERDIEALPDIQRYEKAHEYYTDFIDYLNNVTIEIDKVDFDILNMLLSIEGRIPSAMRISSISVSGEIVTITGIADNDVVIADFIYGMKRLSIFEDTFVPSISGDNYGMQRNFNIGMKLIKEGADEEGEENEEGGDEE
jgi:Tfp pilus assembly protein PilN